MSALAFTALKQADLHTFMHEKSWYKITDQSTELKAFADASIGALAAAAENYSGWAMSFVVSVNYIKGWPVASDVMVPYVTKWSGACFRDASSGMGGFCALEGSDVEMMH